MKLLRYILFPIVPIYFLVTWFRNVLFDKGVFVSKSYDFPVICVGNLSVGGTGKTPMIEYLIRLLKDNKRVATLSRGYKRSTEGFYLADENANASTLGDEPFQFYSQFKSAIQVAVDADRQNGIASLMQQNIPPEIILLDDAFQHRKVSAGLYILLTTYNNLYSDDWVLPTGNLREPRSGAKRAQIIIVTKCPEQLSDSDKDQLVRKLNPEEHQQVFFSAIRYGEDVCSDTENRPLESLNNFTLITGIANANPLVEYLTKKQLNFKHINYNDHHAFTAKDIMAFKNDACILTTEKDFMRLKRFNELQGKLFYLPIEVSIDRSDFFNTKILEFV